MADLDVLLYTSVVVVLFVLFGVSTFNEFRRMNGHEYTGQERSDDTLLFKRFLGKVFG